MQGDQPMGQGPVPPWAQSVHDSIASFYDVLVANALSNEVFRMFMADRVVPVRDLADGPPIALFRRWIIQISATHPGLYVGTWQRQFVGGHRPRIGACGVALDHDGYRLCARRVPEKEIPQ